MTDENIAKKTSYFENMKEKIINNLKIKLKNLHFRLESKYKKSEYSAGVVIDSISSALDLNVKFIQNTFIYQLSDLCIYLNTTDVHFKNIEEEFKIQKNNDRIINCKK